MDVSKFLAKVIGIYLIITSIIMLVHMEQFKIYIDNLIHFGPLMFVTGFFTTILGILMIVSHNIWQCSWRVIITIFGWLTLIKGITLIVFPFYIIKFTVFFIKGTNFAYSSAGFCLFLGILLCFFGLKSEKKQTKSKKVSH